MKTKFWVLTKPQPSPRSFLMGMVGRNAGPSLLVVLGLVSLLVTLFLYLYMK